MDFFSMQNCVHFPPAGANPCKDVVLQRAPQAISRACSTTPIKSDFNFVKHERASPIAFYVAPKSGHNAFMSTLHTNVSQPVIFGRSSSHFTRIARIFAAELGVEYAFHIVQNIMSSDVSDYGGNPALKLPVLQTSKGSWFGALNICRELSRHSSRQLRILWPEDLDQPLTANVQELAAQAMATEVGLIMAKVAGVNEDSTHLAKMRQSLSVSMSWLEANVDEALCLLPKERDLSYLEATLFCLVTHLEFRKILPTAGYGQLIKFCENFALRESSEKTTYRFDA